MTEQIAFKDVKGKLEFLFDEIETGKEFVITKDNKAVARLTKIDDEDNIGTKESVLSLANILDNEQAEEMSSIIADSKTISEREVNF